MGFQAPIRPKRLPREWQAYGAVAQWRRQVHGLLLYTGLAVVAFFVILSGLIAFDHRVLGSASATPGTIAFSQPIEFNICHTGGGHNCVVDGDTFWLASEKIRIADIDTPETHPARCPEEERLGNAAAIRLAALLSSGGFSLEPIGRETDRYGRKLRRVTRDGQSIGDVLIAEGLARSYVGGMRAGWCG